MALSIASCSANAHQHQATLCQLSKYLQVSLQCTDQPSQLSDQACHARINLVLPPSSYCYNYYSVRILYNPLAVSVQTQHPCRVCPPVRLSACPPVPPINSALLQVGTI